MTVQSVENPDGPLAATPRTDLGEGSRENAGMPRPQLQREEGQAQQPSDRNPNVTVAIGDTCGITQSPPSGFSTLYTDDDGEFDPADPLALGHRDVFGNDWDD